MFNKALHQVLFGVLFMTAVTVAYGTFYDRGFVPSVAGVMGLGDREHHGRQEGHDDD